MHSVHRSVTRVPCVRLTGTSVVVKSSAGAVTPNGTQAQSVGSSRYLAPEVTEAFRSTSLGSALGQLLDERCDVYSFGMLLYEVLHGKWAFHQMNALGAMITAMSGERPPLHLRAEHAHLATVLVACWDSDPTRRPSMESVIKSLSIPPVDDACAAPPRSWAMWPSRR
jgi:serine/threonine protein kinase